ncbi:hypothetical protein DL93DRAFT_1987729 [Clavulina sp. PMI_390]|nr:hypothetical protein DL93DRAFT_1987729 [Clavulina sp. PMI_390]
MRSLMIYVGAILLMSLQVLGYGGEILSTSRKTVGSATTAACGSQLASYLAANPTTNLQALALQADSGYDADTCNLSWCKGYQLADSPASEGIFVTTADSATVTVQYSLPTTAVDSRDYYELYVPQLSVVNATSGYPIIVFPSSSDSTLGVTETLDLLLPSVDWMDVPDNELGFVFPVGACSVRGECYVSYQIVDYFRQPTLVSQRFLDSG